MWPVPFYHPAYEAILYAVFNLLPYKAAYFTYVGCNLLLLGACYLLAPPISDPFLKKVPAAAFFFLAFPALICVAEGQDSIVFLFRSFHSLRKLMRGALTPQRAYSRCSCSCKLQITAVVGPAVCPVPYSSACTAPPQRLSSNRNRSRIALRSHRRD